MPLAGGARGRQHFCQGVECSQTPAGISLHLSGIGFLERGPGARLLAEFQGCPLNFSSLRSLRERMKNLYLKGTLHSWVCERLQTFRKTHNWLTKICTGESFSMLFVKDFGAVGDGVTSDHNAITRAMQACRDAGGGTLIFSAGRYLTGPFEIFSNCTLYLETGATIVASPDIKAYFEVNTSVESVRTGLIYARHATNIVIAGKGEIDLNGTAFMDMQHPHIGGGFERRYTRQGEAYLTATEIEDGPVRYLDRPGDSLQFLECEHITLHDIIIRNAPNWTVRFGNCTNVLITGISILNNMLISNSDGIHLTSCRNVRIAACHIEAGDDAIAVTGYGGLDRKTENVHVSHCTLYSRSAGIRMGIVGNVESCIFQNLTIHANRGIGVFVRDEGNVENILFSDIVIHTRLHTGYWWGHAEPIHISAIRDTSTTRLGKINTIRFSNIVGKAQSGILLYGCAESVIENLLFEHVHLTIVPGPFNETYGGNFDLRPADNEANALFAHDECGLYARYVRGLRIHDCTLTWADGLPDYFTHAIQCEQCEQVEIDGFVGRQAQRESTHAAIALNETRHVSIRHCTATRGTGTFLSFDGLSEAKFFVGNDLAEAHTVTNQQDLPFTQYGNIEPSGT